MTYLDDHFEEASVTALNSARAVKRRYPTADVDDLTQMGLVWCIEHPRKFREYADAGKWWVVQKAMFNYQSGYARKERAQYFGYSLEDDVFYSKRMLKGDGGKPGLLDFVFDRAAWPKPPPSDAPRAGGDPAEGNGWLATMCDVSKAVDGLSNDDQVLLKEHYMFGETYEQIGRRLGVAKVTVAKYVDRAVGRLQEALGGSKPREDPPEDDWRTEPAYVGARRAITNAHARALMENM